MHKQEIKQTQSPQLPVSEQEVQIEAPSFIDKLKLQKKKILIGLGSFLGVLILAGAVFGVYKYAQRQIPLVHPEQGRGEPAEGPTPTPTQEVTIATDKTEYEQGEIIKITVNNTSDKPIWYIKETCPPSCCNLYRWEENQWKNLNAPMPCNYLIPPPPGKSYSIEPDELKPMGSISKQWDMMLEGKISESGKYRFSFYYGSSKDNYTEKTVYSNEFTIREKEISKSECKKKSDGTSCTVGLWYDELGRACGGQSCVGHGLGKCYKEECISLEEYENLSKNPQTECLGSCRCMEKCNEKGPTYFIPEEGGAPECSVNSINKTCCCSGV